jgi:hypothetical protein
MLAPVPVCDGDVHDRAERDDERSDCVAGELRGGRNGRQVAAQGRHVAVQVRRRHLGAAEAGPGFAVDVGAVHAKLVRLKDDGDVDRVCRGRRGRGSQRRNVYVVDVHVHHRQRAVGAVVVGGQSPAFAREGNQAGPREVEGQVGGGSEQTEELGAAAECGVHLRHGGHAHPERRGGGHISSHLGPVKHERNALGHVARHHVHHSGLHGHAVQLHQGQAHAVH